MKITRKDFLRLSGLSLLALAGGKAVRAVTALAGAPATAGAGTAKTIRWGMVIDLAKWRNQADPDKCVKACNAAHNVPQIPDPAREVRWIWDQPFETVFPSEQTDYTRQTYAGKPIPVMCNHCENPACVRVCPTGATWKREDGIVMMDWHRCIGCKYCIVACPYGARSFNFSDPVAYIAKVNPEFPTRCKGVVEKCNFCAERLAEGKQPVCVESSPDKAMIFGNLADPDSEIRQVLGSRFSIRRKPELGTQPNVFYIV
jgi:molybdopterin-containing oxidoreductase family iron-sulfur binding subunit